MNAEQTAVLAAFERMQQAMIDKDTETMLALVTEDKTFTHMSGKKQTKEEFFGEIEDGTLNYHKYKIHDPVVVVDGDTATQTADTTLTARVYGISGRWTLATKAHFVKIDGASPHQTNPAHILNLDMVGTGYALDAFGKVMAAGGAGWIISSQTGYMYPIPYETEQEILAAPTEKLMELPFIQETAMQNSGLAYMIAKTAA